MEYLGRSELVRNVVERGCQISNLTRQQKVAQPPMIPSASFHPSFNLHHKAANVGGKLDGVEVMQSTGKYGNCSLKSRFIAIQLETSVSYDRRSGPTMMDEDRSRQKSRQHEALNQDDLKVHEPHTIGHRRSRLSIFFQPRSRRETRESQR